MSETMKTRCLEGKDCSFAVSVAVVLLRVALDSWTLTDLMLYDMPSNHYIYPALTYHAISLSAPSRRHRISPGL